jgi:hypothetical protein
VTRRQERDPLEHQTSQRIGHADRIQQARQAVGVGSGRQFQREERVPPDLSCICSSSDRPGENAVRVARSSRVAPRLSGLSRMRSTLAAGARSVAIGRGSADQSVRTAASSPTGSSLKRRSAKDNMRAEAASIHGRSSTMTRTARLLVRRRNSVSTAVAVVRGSAGPQLVAGAWFGVLPGVVLAAAVPAARRSCRRDLFEQVS